MGDSYFVIDLSVTRTIRSVVVVNRNRRFNSSHRCLVACAATFSSHDIVKEKKKKARERERGEKGKIKIKRREREGRRQQVVEAIDSCATIKHHHRPPPYSAANGNSAARKSIFNRRCYKLKRITRNRDLIASNIYNTVLDIVINSCAVSIGR